MARLLGSSEFKVNGGIAVISDIIITAQPGNSVLISFSTDGIDLEKPSNKKAIEQTGNYSLIKMNEPGFCEICPTTKAKCLGGAEIGPLPGFWRRSNSSKTFEKCIYQPACLGMIPPINNPMGECLLGYKGILCGDCQKGYSRDLNFQLIILVVFMVRSTIKGAKDTSNH
ncbi:UNKNOWN [Stylonychia lemnae]|uniref:Uncharacterized protein n=1 Tax=Stylonychia lemnae TaxID=5949 RepID=A0A078B3K5_STYLE|nr:UNKNOWN [Stylonychia lemnae]|eukprot:CDW89115.1 UNKNOWN [Stylonychia lemnae]